MIYLMRHGESAMQPSRGQPAGRLTSRGRQQVTKAGHWLADRAITAIYTSASPHCVQSAQMIGGLLGVTPVVDDDLREIDFGKLDGRTKAWQVLQEVVRHWQHADRTRPFPEDEWYRRAYDRFAAALQRASQAENALLVTHGGITLNVVPFLCVNAAALQRVSTPAYTGFVVLEPYDPGRYTCDSWNLTEHL